ncbi:MAG TPA: tRNA (adenosine(37)-N6)-dimethylallyltransferase MiaA [Phycisphaerae bacterium]|nr:tRNA (adenosine(37)-N6)-dimethylallyltransferase MiaA [Phycisphaerae bacterium]HRW51953.1 tRNA (adenosine(37)-N6)-dimethylallyltransferase MiaA [Phycisphaerae bacterium]
MSERAHIEIDLLLGVTASGKSACSLAIADRLNAEIVSVDSMQVYRGMDIGTAKASPAELASTPHHLIDVVDPWDAFSAARFTAMADAAIEDITRRGRRPLIVGGTPLYVMSLIFGMFEGPSADAAFRDSLRRRAETDGTPALHVDLNRIDPEAASRIHPNDYKRIERALEVHHITGQTLSSLQTQWDSGRTRYPTRAIGLRREKEDASRRINARVRQMIAEGLVEETRRLLAHPNGMSEQARQALGYAQIIDHLEGRCSLEDAIEQIKIQTRRFAKHQRTWFRKFLFAKWIDVAETDTIESVADSALALLESIPPSNAG